MAEPSSFERTVAPADAGVRLDVFLANQPEVGGRGAAKRLIEAGRVQVPGQRVRPSLPLPGGQQVRFAVDPRLPGSPLEPGLPLPEVRVLYEDPALVAIDKPVGLAAHPPEGKPHFREHTVASWALARYGQLPTGSPGEADDRPGIVHRLDRDTSGAMVIARTDAAYDFLRNQFRLRTAQKEYRCIVYGEPRFQSDWIERPIGTDPRHPDRMAVVSEGGRESSTYYEVVERFAGFAHVRCKPVTGRTHQIRVHMTSIGHSLVGDRIYRSLKRQHDALPPGAPDPGRQCLHALRLSLPHPEHEERLEIEAPLPDDFARLLQWLRAHRALGSGR